MAAKEQLAKWPDFGDRNESYIPIILERYIKQAVLYQTIGGSGNTCHF